MKEIKDFIEISKYAGERLDLIQAAGGNSSVKLNSGEMLIKASGYLLSDLNKNFGYSTVYTKDVSDIVINKEILKSNNKREREYITSNLLKKATIDKNNRPSIETLLHSLLLKYTLHTHSIVVNMIVIKKNWKRILKKIFNDNINIAYVSYETPGIELAIALHKELKKFNKIPKIIILQNHGLIITSNIKKEIRTLTEYVLTKIENYININMSKYKLTNDISSLFNSIYENSNISYLCEDLFLNENLIKNNSLFLNTPFCPDTLVYCGINSVKIKSVLDKKSIIEYEAKNHEYPKVIIFKNNIFFRASSLKRAKEIEEVLKLHIMVLASNKSSNLNYLDNKELLYLSKWEAEKFRQNL